LFEFFESHFFDFIDIGVVSLLIYWVLRLIRGTRAVYMLLGLAIFVSIYWLSDVAQLDTLHWILSKLFGSLLLVVVVVFQNDIRRMLTQIGRTPFFSAFGSSQEGEMIEELVKTAVSLANKKIGALIVLERNADLSDYVEVGTKLDAVPSKEILTSIFLPSSPIHDGAVLIQKGRITAAGCFLPLTLNPQVDSDYGTRHRAAIGLSEETDAIVIVVSEERGWISVVVEGRVMKGLDGLALRKLLLGHFRPAASLFRRLGIWVPGLGREKA
jgi:diadenylate cyclase